MPTLSAMGSQLGLEPRGIYVVKFRSAFAREANKIRGLQIMSVSPFFSAVVGVVIEFRSTFISSESMPIFSILPWGQRPFLGEAGIPISSLSP